MGQFLFRRLPESAAERRNADATGQKNRRPGGILAQAQRAEGPTIRTSVPSGMVLRMRLNGVSRLRVAIIKSGSPGALAIEKFRIPPSASVSGFSASRANAAAAPGHSKMADQQG